LNGNTNTGASSQDRLHGTRFAIVPEWVIYGEVSDRAIRLYAVLARHANTEHVAFPLRTTMAKLCRCSVDSIDRAVRELVEVGALIVEHQFAEGGKQRANLYTLVFDDPRGRTGAVGVAAQLRLPGRTDAAQNDNHGTRTIERSFAAAPRKRKPDLLWEVFDEELGEVSNAGERGKRNKALKLIRESMNGLDDEAEQATALRTHIERYREHWPDMPATEMAIANNWTVTMRAPKRKRGLTSEEIRAMGRRA
jgi:hypothetical protein